MCDFMSGFFKPDTMEVKVADLNSHGDTARALKLLDGPSPNGWRELHYRPNETMECRVLPGDAFTAKQAEAQIRERWPRFVDFLSWSLRQPTYIGVYLDLGGLTSAERDAVLKTWKRK